jgi:hypothetical protein
VRTDHHDLVRSGFPADLPDDVVRLVRGSGLGVEHGRESQGDSRPKQAARPGRPVPLHHYHRVPVRQAERGVVAGQAVPWTRGHVDQPRCPRRDGPPLDMRPLGVLPEQSVEIEQLVGLDQDVGAPGPSAQRGVVGLRPLAGIDQGCRESGRRSAGREGERRYPGTEAHALALHRRPGRTLQPEAGHLERLLPRVHAGSSEAFERPIESAAVRWRAGRPAADLVGESLKILNHRGVAEQGANEAGRSVGLGGRRGGRADGERRGESDRTKCIPHTGLPEPVSMGAAQGSRCHPGTSSYLQYSSS